MHKQNYTLTKPHDAIRKFYSHLSEFLTHKRRSRVSTPCICLECHPGLLLMLNICVLFSLKDVSFGLPKDVSFGLPEEKGVMRYSIMWSYPADYPCMRNINVSRFIAIMINPKDCFTLGVIIGIISKENVKLSHISK